MAVPTAAPRAPRPLVIDLVSSDDEEDRPRIVSHRQRHDQNLLPQATPPAPQMGNEAFDGLFSLDDLDDPFTDAQPARTPDQLGNHEKRRQSGEVYNIEGVNVFVADSLEPERTGSHQDHAYPAPGEDGTVAPSMEDFTADTCVQRVLTIFPDISHQYIHDLYNEFDTQVDYQTLPGPFRFENIVEKLVSGEPYPKQEKGKYKKRKRDDEDDDGKDKRWENPDRPALPSISHKCIAAMLKADFPDIPNHIIVREVALNKHLYQTYLILANLKDSSDHSTKWRGRPAGTATAHLIAEGSVWPGLMEELTAARKRVEHIRVQRIADKSKQKAENENLQRAIAAGATAECQACFEELPMNRQIHCDGEAAHFTCFDCATAYVKSEVGDSRCRVLCTFGCGAGFAHAQLHLLEDKPLLAKLEQLQQEKDIRDAGLDNLEECPFCDYKAILPPVEVDFEFRCANPECERVSCRRCKATSHIPLSCEEHAKDNKLNSRHEVEEAMTAALIRSCNKCKKQFIKEHGCNKMTCPSCGNLQCYVCSTSLKDYNHFNQNGSGNGSTSSKCPLYDNVEERHEREVREAEVAARARIIEENPDVAVQDLEIKVSDAVTKATQSRINGANIPDMHDGAAMGLGGLFRMPRRRHRFDRALANNGEDDHGDGDDDDAAMGLYLDVERAYGAQRRRVPPGFALHQRDNNVAVPNYLMAHALPHQQPAPLQHPPSQHQQPPAAGPQAGMQGWPLFGLTPQQLYRIGANPQQAANDGLGQVQAPPLGVNFLGGLGGLANFPEDPFAEDVGAFDPFAMNLGMNDGPRPGVQQPAHPRMAAAQVPAMPIPPQQNNEEQHRTQIRYGFQQGPFHQRLMEQHRQVALRVDQLDAARRRFDQARAYLRQREDAR